MTGSEHKAAPQADQPRRRARPSPGRPTRAQAIERERELLDKALDLFLEHGFEGTSIDAITAAVGMAKRTVYARFADKRMLFEAALKRAIDDWRVPAQRLQAAETEDLEASLLAVGRILVANVLSREGLRLLQITNAESARMPEIGAYTSQEGTRTTVEYLAGLFRRRLPQAGAGAQAADSAALAFLYLVVGGPANLVAWGAKLEADAIDRMTVYNVHLFLNGLLPR